MALFVVFEMLEGIPLNLHLFLFSNSEIGAEMLRHGVQGSGGRTAQFPVPKGCEEADGETLLAHLDDIFEQDTHMYGVCFPPPVSQINMYFFSDEVGLILSTGFEESGQTNVPQKKYWGQCAFISQEHKLGVAFWCIIKVFTAAKTRVSGKPPH
jgi:hypothetical protein